MALPRTHRLTDRAQIGRIVRSGRSLFVPGMRAAMVRSLAAHSRCTIIVPKSVDKRSTVRNTLRRRVAETMRPILSRFDPPIDAVLTLEKGATQLTAPELRARVLDLFKKSVT